MKTTAAILLFALLSGAAGAALADVHVYVNCKAADGNCPPPPTPPKPPRPPAPPTPPAPPAPPMPGDALAASPADAAMPATPAIPAPPAPPAPPTPPAPPSPPKLPPVPESAHADCATKKPGTRLSFTLKPGETMTGVCRKQGGRMVFSLREYELHE
jgi:hypothetical protein